MIPEDIFTEKNLSCARKKRQETHLKSIAPARIFSRFTIAPKHAIISSVAMNGNAFPIPDEESRADGESADGKGWPLARERYREMRRLAHVMRKSGPECPGKQSGTAKCFQLRLCIFAGTKLFCSRTSNHPRIKRRNPPWNSSPITLLR